MSGLLDSIEFLLLFLILYLVLITLNLVFFISSKAWEFSE